MLLSNPSTENWKRSSFGYAIVVFSGCGWHVKLHPQLMEDRVQLAREVDLARQMQISSS